MKIPNLSVCMIYLTVFFYVCFFFIGNQTERNPFNSCSVSVNKSLALLLPIRAQTHMFYDLIWTNPLRGLPI